MLYGYGGFEISLRPRYSARLAPLGWSAAVSMFWPTSAAAASLAPNGTRPHCKEKHQNAFDDFIAVAEDLIERKITTPEHLGIVGGSNGGLLVGGCFIQRPELYNAVVCQVPLLDMKRYNKLLAGASWMAEYGNPDTDDWEFMKTWSPYQNLDKDQDYPKVFFYTSTRDDRVHPATRAKWSGR